MIGNSTSATAGTQGAVKKKKPPRLAGTWWHVSHPDPVSNATVVVRIIKDDAQQEKKNTEAKIKKPIHLGDELCVFIFNNPIFNFRREETKQSRDELATAQHSVAFAIDHGHRGLLDKSGGL